MATIEQLALWITRQATLDTRYGWIPDTTIYADSDGEKALDLALGNGWIRARPAGPGYSATIEGERVVNVHRHDTWDLYDEWDDACRNSQES